MSRHLPPEKLLELRELAATHKAIYMTSSSILTQLLDHIDELQARLDAIEKLHHVEPNPCHPERTCCVECLRDAWEEPHPCPTIKAARGEL